MNNRHTAHVYVFVHRHGSSHSPSKCVLQNILIPGYSKRYLNGFTVNRKWTHCYHLIFIQNVFWQYQNDYILSTIFFVRTIWLSIEMHKFNISDKNRTSSRTSDPVTMQPCAIILLQRGRLCGRLLKDK